MEKEICTIEMINEIACIKFNKAIKIELEHAIEMVGTRKKATNNTPRLVIMDGTNITNVSKEARDYLSSEEATEGIIAGAFLVDSPLTKILGNFFLKISKPNKPSKLFTNREEAIEWLWTNKITE
jgi:hypothetical protein